MIYFSICVCDRYDVDTNQQCVVNTSNLNEELGQVEKDL